MLFLNFQTHVPVDLAASPEVVKKPPVTLYSKVMEKENKHIRQSGHFKLVTLPCCISTNGIWRTMTK